MIDKIIYHRKFDDTHPTADAGKLLYRIHWFLFELEEDMWEPIDHLLLHQVFIFHYLLSLTSLKSIYQAING